MKFMLGILAVLFAVSAVSPDAAVAQKAIRTQNLSQRRISVRRPSKPMRTGHPTQRPIRLLMCEWLMSADTT